MIFEDLFRNPLHLMTLLIIVMLFMGGSRLTDTMGSLGKGIKDFKANIKDDPEPSAAAGSLAMAAAAPSSAAAVDATPSPNAALARVEVVQALGCPKCGNLNPLGSKLCNQCGAPVA